MHFANQTLSLKSNKVEVNECILGTMIAKRTPIREATISDFELMLKS